jgi:hypothetical protein
MRQGRVLIVVIGRSWFVNVRFRADIVAKVDEGQLGSNNRIATNKVSNRYCASGINLESNIARSDAQNLFTTVSSAWRTQVRHRAKAELVSVGSLPSWLPISPVYSRLTGADEQGTYVRLKGHLRILLDPGCGRRGRRQTPALGSWPCSAALWTRYVVRGCPARHDRATVLFTTLRLTKGLRSL